MSNEKDSTTSEGYARPKHHETILRERGISPEVAAAYGLSYYDGPELIRLREEYEIVRYRRLPLHRTTGILMPYPRKKDYLDGSSPWNGSGADYHRVRADETSIEIEEFEGAGSHGRKTITIPRYFAVAGPVLPYFTWPIFESLNDTSRPIVFAEAPLKAISVSANLGVPAVGLGGVLAGAHDKAALETLGEICLHKSLLDIRWGGRTALIAFDAGLGGYDQPGNPMVALGAARLWKALSDLGAEVRLIRLPYFHPQDVDIDRCPEWRVEDQGPDDFIFREGKDAFMVLMDQAESAEPVEMMSAALAESKPSERAGLVAQLTRDTYFQAALCAGGPATLSAVAAITSAKAKLGKRDLQTLVSSFDARIQRRLKEHEPGWKDELILSANGAARNVGANVETALRKDSGLYGLVGYDSFRNQLVFLKTPPWTEQYSASRSVGSGTCWQGEDTTRLGHHLSRSHGIVDVPERKIEATVAVVARDHEYHPVRKYLEALTWDGTSRLSGWLTSYLGVEESEYSTRVAQWWLISAVARVLSPGCKADCILVLEGRQGLRKSSALGVLGGEWFSDADLGDLKSKEAALNLQGRWIVELPEGEIFSRASAEQLKSFTSKRADDLVPKYANFPVRLPRQAVFALTINDCEYLTDATGNRRFLPVACTKVDLTRLQIDRDQLWAEAKVLYDQGASWWPETEEEEEFCRYQTRNRLATDPWHSAICDGLAGKSQVTVDQLLDLIGVSPESRTRSHSLRVTKVLTALGWIHGQRSAKTRPWVPGEHAEVFPAVELSDIDDSGMDFFE